MGMKNRREYFFDGPNPSGKRGPRGSQGMKGVYREKKKKNGSKGNICHKSKPTSSGVPYGPDKWEERKKLSTAVRKKRVHWEEVSSALGPLRLARF